MFQSPIKFALFFSSKNRYRLLKNLMRAEPQVLHPLLELLSYRVLRFFKYHNSMVHLFLSLHECAMSTTHHQLFHLVQNLLLKISHNFHEVMKFSKTNQEIDFGESLNRNLVISLAKTIKTKYVFSLIIDQPPNNIIHSQGNRELCASAGCHTIANTAICYQVKSVSLLS